MDNMCDILAQVQQQTVKLDEELLQNDFNKSATAVDPVETIMHKRKREPRAALLRLDESTAWKVAKLPADSKHPFVFLESPLVYFLLIYSPVCCFLFEPMVLRAGF